MIECLHNLPHPIAVVAFEDYGPIGRTSSKITARAEICGIIKSHVLQSIAAPILMVSPSALKQYATGNGNSKKEAVMQAAAAEGFIARCSDEADAYFAARIGQNVILGNKVGVAFSRVNP